MSRFYCITGIVRKDMAVNELERLSDIELGYIKVKEQRFYSCSTFHSHSSVFNKEQHSYYKTSIKQHLTCSLAVQTLFKFTITLIF